MSTNPSKTVAFDENIKTESPVTKQSDENANQNADSGNTIDMLPNNLTQDMEKWPIKIDHIEPMQGDASPRLYYRGFDVINQPYMICLYPTVNDLHNFLETQALFQALGVSVPQIYYHSDESRIIIQQYVGEHSLGQYHDLGKSRKQHFKKAVDLIAKWQGKVQGDIFVYHTRETLPVLDLDFFTIQMELFLQSPALYLQKPIPAELKQAFFDRWCHYLSQITTENDRELVHRDFHVDNLMFHTQQKKLYVIDFQDVCLGHSLYDLVSLIEDPRRDFGDELRGEMLFFYEQLMKRPVHKKHYAIISAQRLMGIIGIFHRLCYTENKPKYMQYVSRCFDRIKTHLESIEDLGLVHLFNDIMPYFADSVGE